MKNSTAGAFKCHLLDVAVAASVRLQSWVKDCLISMPCKKCLASAATLGCGWMSGGTNGKGFEETYLFHHVMSCISFVCNHPEAAVMIVL